MDPLPYTSSPTMKYIIQTNEWSPNSYAELRARGFNRKKRTAGESDNPWTSDDDKTLNDALLEWDSLIKQCTRTDNVIGWVADTVFGKSRSRAEVERAVCAFIRKRLSEDTAAALATAR